MGIEARERCPGQIAAPVAPTSINKDEIIGECQRRLYVLVTDYPTTENCRGKIFRSRMKNNGLKLLPRGLPVLKNRDGGSGAFLLHDVHEESLAVGRDGVLLFADVLNWMRDVCHEERHGRAGFDGGPA
jgi:hypothetical protein